MSEYKIVEWGVRKRREGGREEEKRRKITENFNWK